MIIKQFCSETGLTYTDLSNMTKIGLSSIQRYAEEDVIPQQPNSDAIHYCTIGLVAANDFSGHNPTFFTRYQPASGLMQFTDYIRYARITKSYFDLKAGITCMDDLIKKGR